MISSIYSTVTLIVTTGTFLMQEENTGSDVDSSSNTNDNQAPQDSHRRKYTVDEITNVSYL